MLIRIGAEELREACSCRMKAVAYVVSHRLDRSVWATPYGLWVKGLNNEGLIEWDAVSHQKLAAYLAGETEDVELELPDELLASANPGTTFQSMKKR